jgi:hypothetical protein
MQEISSIPKRGDANESVGDVQQRLKHLGYNPGAVDGIFGAATARGVSAFQKANGLPGSGIMGPKTIKALGFEVRFMAPRSGQETITRDLKGRKSRFIHPTLRLLLEAKLFPGGRIPEAFRSVDIPRMTVLAAVALESLKVREIGGNNRGPLVGLIQDIIGPYAQNGTGDAWCMSTTQILVAIIEDYCQAESPVLDSEGCMNVYTSALSIQGLTTLHAEAGSMFICQNGKKWTGHTGLVLEVLPGKMRTFEGNTGDGDARDGDGAYFRTRGLAKFASKSTLELRGFVRIYPHNELPDRYAQTATMPF